MGSPAEEYPVTPKLKKEMLRPLREEWKDYIDDYGLIVQHLKRTKGEGGDTLQRVCMMKIAIEIIRKKKPTYDLRGFPYEIDSDFQMALNWLEHERRKGQYRRHPDWKMWYSRWGTHCTRDQARPLVPALGITKSYDRLFDFFFRHLTRRALLWMDANRKNHQWEDRAEHEHNTDGAWNGDKWRWPDPTGPQFWASYFRAFFYEKEYIVALVELSILPIFWNYQLDWKWIFILPSVILNVLDIHTLVASVQNACSKKTGEINHIVDLAWANMSYPTLVSFLAKLVYCFKRRTPVPAPKNGAMLDENFGPQMVLNHYFRPENDGGPMNQIWKHVIDWMYPRKGLWGKMREWAEKRNKR